MEKHILCIMLYTLLYTIYYYFTLYNVTLHYIIYYYITLLNFIYTDELFNV